MICTGPYSKGIYDMTTHTGWILIYIWWWNYFSCEKQEEIYGHPKGNFVPNSGHQHANYSWAWFRICAEHLISNYVFLKVLKCSREFWYPLRGDTSLSFCISLSILSTSLLPFSQDTSSVTPKSWFSISCCFNKTMPYHTQGFPGGSDSKESACNAGDPGLISGSGRSVGEGNGHPP